MLSNCPAITYYHKELDKNKLEKWIKYEFHKIWIYSVKGSIVNQGYTNANKVEILIPLIKIEDTELLTIGDIVCIGEQEDITSQNDLQGKEFYNITSIEINNYGNYPHVRLGGI